MIFFTYSILLLCILIYPTSTLFTIQYKRYIYIYIIYIYIYLYLYLYLDNTAPAILVDVASTAALTEENLEVNNDLLLTENQKGRNTTYLAIKSIV